MLNLIVPIIVFLSTTFAANIPPGRYAIVNIATQTYMNLLDDLPIPAPIVCSVGNNDSDDSWNIAPSTSIQSQYDGSYLSLSEGGVVSSASAYTWTLYPANKAYSFLILSDAYTALAQDSTLAGAPVYSVYPSNVSDPTQSWWFVALPED